MLLLLASLCGVAALAVQKWSPAGGSTHQLEVLLRCELLGRGVPLEALLLQSAKVNLGPESGARFTLAAGPSEDPSVFEARIEAQSELGALTALAELKPALSAVLAELATKEVRLMSSSLEEIALPREPLPGASSEASAPTPLEPAFHPREREKALRLSTEIGELEAFLAGGAEPVWFSGRLDRALLVRSRENLQRAESELSRLREIFKDGGKTVEAQREVVRLAKKELADNKVHLAKNLLRAYRQELGQLEELARSRITANATRLAGAAPVEAPEPENGESREWLESVTHKLTADQKKLEALAEVHQVGEPVIFQRSDSSYWTALGLWIGAGVFFLLGLFAPRREPAADSTPTPQPRPLGSFSSRGRSESEPFLLESLSAIKEELGRPPSRLLILGESNDTARASASARIARTVSATGRKVRLVDFDFQTKTLTEKLGNLETVGVSDLIAGDAPVDEFLASVSGTEIEFAPAGNRPFVHAGETPRSIDSLLTPRHGGMLVVDASFSSPLHLVVGHVEAVICVTSRRRQWSEREQEVLLALKEADLPIWGLMQGDPEIYPFT